MEIGWMSEVVTDRVGLCTGLRAAMTASAALVNVHQVSHVVGA